MSASNAQLYTLFNNKLCDFFEDLYNVIGHLPEYSILTSSATLLSKIDPSQNHKFWVQHVESHYGEKIAARDESFFLQNDYSTHLEPGCTSPDIVTMLKHTWGTLSEDDKTAVWDHLDVLLKISGYIMSEKKTE